MVFLPDLEPGLQFQRDCRHRQVRLINAQHAQVTSGRGQHVMRADRKREHVRRSIMSNGVHVRSIPSVFPSRKDEVQFADSETS